MVKLLIFNYNVFLFKGTVNFFSTFSQFFLTFPYFCITIGIMIANLKSTEFMTTARLPFETRNKLLALARVKNKTKSQIIIESLEMYYKQEESQIDSYTLGLPYFGKYGSGAGDLSTTYKERIKKGLRARQNSY
jgi:hypothetical protein